jgi:hypothetical protein
MTSDNAKRNKDIQDNNNTGRASMTDLGNTAIDITDIADVLSSIAKGRRTEGCKLHLIKPTTSRDSLISYY